MNNRRLELQNLLEELLGSSNVYYNAPSNVKMNYPCIRYTKEDIYDVRADNHLYMKKDRYQLMVISKTPDNPVIDKLLELEMCTYDRHYCTDNLNHDVLSIYF